MGGGNDKGKAGPSGMATGEGLVKWLGFSNQGCFGGGGGWGGAGKAGGKKEEDQSQASKSTRPDAGINPQLVQVSRPEKGGAVAVEPKTELEEAEWFHGLLPRSEIVGTLGEEGSWLVRSTEKEDGVQIVISVKWKGAVKHIMLKRTERGWVMPEKSFGTVAELVFYYHRSGEPVNEAGVQLKGRPVARRSWMVPSRDVQIQKKIGEGNFGEVFKGLLRVYKSAPHSPQTWIPVALKTCKALVGRNEKEEFMKEAKMMLQYQHPHVVRIYAVAADKPPLMLVMEMCSGGSLNGYLEKNYPKTEIRTKVRLCLECAEGMEYLAMEKDCVHRDLAARNVLLGAALDAKIADFGLTRQGTYQMTASSQNRQIPVRWTAPEALATGRFTRETDVWSFGILAWEVLADAEKPWPGKDIRQAFRAAKAGEKMDSPPFTPPALTALLHRTWNLNPKLRPNMTDVRKELAHIYASLPAPKA